MGQSHSDRAHRHCGGGARRIPAHREKGRLDFSSLAVILGLTSMIVQVKNPVMPLWLWKQPSFAAIWFAAFFMQAW